MDSSVFLISSLDQGVSCLDKSCFASRSYGLSEKDRPEVLVMILYCNETGVDVSTVSEATNLGMVEIGRKCGTKICVNNNLI